MQEYHDKAKRGIKLLLGRQVFVQVITFSGGIILARTLDPADFGLYVISSLMVGMFAIIGDFGLAPSFIQRKQELVDLELQVGFTVQQVLTSILVLLMLIGGPYIARYLYPDLPLVVWLVRALSFNLYLTSWRSMSALQLERQMRYDRLARIEIVEMLVYQGLAVTLALAGARTWSYIVATLVSGLLGTCMIYLASPWKVRLRFDRKIAWELIRFGVPFQFQAIVNSLGSWLIPWVVGRQIGPQAVGYLTWASSNGKKPLMVTDSVMRVAFPHFSRIQDNPAEVERIVVRYLSGLLMLAMLWFTGIVVTCPGLVELIYKPKWAPAVPALMMYAASLVLDMTSMVLGITLNSIGKLNQVTKLLAIRTATNIVLALFLIYLMRNGNAYNGVPLAYLLSSILTVPPLMRVLGKGASSRILLSVSWLLVPTLLGITFGSAVSWVTRPSPLAIHVLASGATSVLFFGVGTWFFAPRWMRDKITAKWRTFTPDSQIASSSIK